MKDINLKSNYPVLSGQDTEFQELLKSAFEKTDDFSALSPTGGSWRDRQIAANWLSQPEHEINPSNVYIASGGHPAIIACILAAGLHNKKIVVEEFTYSNFKLIAKLFGITLIPCAVDPHGIRPSLLSRTCTMHKPSALYIMPTLSNPLGTVMPVERRNEIIAVARKNNLLIIEDDAYGFLDDTLLPNFFHLAPERSFYIQSFSKSFIRAIKTSYVLCPGQFADNMTGSLYLTAATPSALSCLVLNKTITSGKLKSLIKAKQDEGYLRQQKVKVLLSDFDLYGHKNGWHLWLYLPGHIKATELDKKLVNEGVSIAPSTMFSAKKNLYNGAIRIAYGNEPYFNNVIKGIEIIKQQIDSW